jgi:hemoglobin
LVELLTYEPGERILFEGQIFEVVKEARTRWGSPTYQIREASGGAQKWLTPRRADRPAPYVDRATIRSFVDGFYAVVDRDPVLGPVFAPRIHGDWGPHLDKMVRFWSMVLLREPGYSGQPPVVHRAVEELRPEHFQRWLELFGKTLHEVFEPELADALARKVFDMSRGLSNAIFGEPWTETLGVTAR